MAQRSISFRESFAQAVERVGGVLSASKILGCSDEFVRLMLKDKKTPGLNLAVRIQERLGVPVESWKHSKTRTKAAI